MSYGQALLGINCHRNRGRCICDSCVQCMLSVLFSVMMRGADITLYPASGVFAVIMISDISFQS